MAVNVTLIPGDGTGPEITRATVRVLRATGVGINWDTVQVDTAGAGPASEAPYAAALDSIRRNKVALAGPLATAQDNQATGGIAALRGELGLYACLRPCKSYADEGSRQGRLDLVIVSGLG